jgi:hemoglobin-like flavoprotein
MDPSQIDDPQTQILSQAVHGYITSIDNRLSMHDFRIVTGPTHTNLIFDVVTPYHFQMSDRELVDKISAIVKEHHPNHFCVIDVDKQMV